MNQPIRQTKFSKQAMIDWDQVKSASDVKIWHKVYTPWFSDQDIDGFIKIYDIKLQNPKQDELYIKDKFEMLSLKSV